MLVGQAINALDEVPPDTTGHHYGKKFMNNDWKMGPFYSWDPNYLELYGQK